MATSGHLTKETTPTDLELRAYSVSEVLDRVPIGRTKLYEEIRNGHLLTIKKGSRTLITAKAFHDWLYPADNDETPSPRPTTGKRATS